MAESNQVATSDGGSRDDYVKAIAPYLQMETKLSSAPLSLAVMANLNLIAAQADDFSLLMGASDTDLKENNIIRNPTSFKGTVVQVSNEIYAAFQSADGAMKNIKLYMSPRQLPRTIQDILELIEEGTGSEVCEELPGDVKKVRKILDKCIEKSDDVVKKFGIVMSTLSEMIRLTTITQGASKKDMKEYEYQRKSEEKSQIYLQERIDTMKRELEELETRKDEEYRAYKDKLQDMGSATELLKLSVAGLADVAVNDALPIMARSGGMALAANFMSTGESVALAGTEVVRTLTPAVSTALGVGAGASQEGAISQTASSCKTSELCDAEVEGILHKLDESLNDILENAFEDSSSNIRLNALGLKNNPLLGVVNKQCESFLEELNQIAINKKYTSLGQVTTICNQLQKSIKEVEKHEKQPTQDDSYEDEIAALHLQFTDMRKKVKHLSTPPEKSTKSGLATQLMQGVSSAMGGKKEGSSAIAKSMIEGSRTQLKMSQQDYQDTKKELEAMKDKELEYNKSMQNIIRKMAEYKENEATAAKTLEVASTALEALGKAKEHWHDILVYFEGAKAIIDVALTKPLEDFTTDSETAMRRISEGGSKVLADRFKKRLKRSVDDAERVIQLLFHFSSNYHQISGDFIMPMVASFGRMISMRDPREIEKLQKEINDKAIGMQDTIETLIQSNHTRYGLEYKPT